MSLVLLFNRFDPNRLLPSSSTGVASVSGTLKGKGKLKGYSFGVCGQAEQQNLALYSEDLSNAVWEKLQCTINPNVDTDLDGHATMDQNVDVDYTAYIRQNGINIVAGKDYCYSFDVKRGTANPDYMVTHVYLVENVYVNVVNREYYGPETSNSEVRRITRYFTAPVGALKAMVYLLIDYSVGTASFGRVQLAEVGKKYIATSGTALTAPGVAGVTGNLTKFSLHGLANGVASVTGNLRERTRPEENLFLWSEDMTNAVWYNSDANSFVANQANDMNGQLTLDGLTPAGEPYISQVDMPVEASTAYTLSVEVYSPTAPISGTPYFIETLNQNYTVITNTPYDWSIGDSGWSTLRRITITFTTPAGTTALRMTFGGGYAEQLMMGRWHLYKGTPGSKKYVTTQGSVIVKRVLEGHTDAGASVSAALTGVTGSTTQVGSSSGVATVSATLKGKGALATASNGVASVSAVIKGKTSLSTTINGVSTVSATIRAKGRLTAQSNGVALNSSTIRAKGRLISQSNGIATVSAVVRAKGTLLATSNGIATVSAVIRAKGILIAISNGIASISATITGIGGGSGAILGVINGIASITGILRAKGRLISSSNGVALNSGILLAKGRLISQSNGVASIVGVIRAKGRLISQSNGVALNSGILRAKGRLIAISNGIATDSGVLRAKGRLIVAITCSPTITGTLYNSSPIGLLGIISGISTVSGVLRAKGRLIAQSNGITSVIPFLQIRCKIYATSNGVSTNSSILRAKGRLIAQSNGVTTDSGILRAKGMLISVSNGISLNSGILRGRARLIGSSTGVGLVGGILGGKGDLKGNILSYSIVVGVCQNKGVVKGILQGRIDILGGVEQKYYYDSKDNLYQRYPTNSGNKKVFGVKNIEGNLLGSIFIGGRATSQSFMYDLDGRLFKIVPAHSNLKKLVEI